MKFNEYQEAAILDNIAIFVPHLDTRELWYHHIAPFFNEREINASGALHLANSPHELAQVIRVIAADLVLRKIREYTEDIDLQHQLIATMPQEALHSVARAVGDAIRATMEALKKTPISG